MCIYSSKLPDRIPYCYLIGWSKLGKYYYGCQYGKNCNPKNLMRTYFTSSKLVKKYIDKYGIPDVIQIRKIFNNVKECRLWEIKVLTRLNATLRDDFLNLRNPGGVHNFTDKKNIPWNKGKKGLWKNPYKGVKNRYTPEQLKTISENTKKAMQNLSVESRTKLINSNKIKCKGLKWMHDKDNNHIRVNVDQIDIKESEGWILGRIVKHDPITGNFSK